VETRRHLIPSSRLAVRPCPFCGRSSDSSVVDELRFFEGFESRTLHQVTCRCGANGPVRPSAAEAAEAWNAASVAEDRAPRRSASNVLPEALAG
jgi:Lar family restriction alleviation protein